MAKYDKVDLKLTEDGDLVIEKGDLALVRKQEFINQSARNRVKTNDPEWPDYQGIAIGANFEDLRGKPNTIETAREGVEKLTDCLTRDGLIDPEDLYIQPVPIDRKTIVFFVFINSPYEAEPTGFQVKLNLDTGVAIRGV
jgi:hypothetical protein